MAGAPVPHQWVEEDEEGEQLAFINACLNPRRVVSSPPLGHVPQLGHVRGKFFNHSRMSNVLHYEGTSK